MSGTYRTYGGRVPMEVIVRARNFAGMHPVMQDRVRALMEASGGQAGWGMGLRTAQQQLGLFLSRHEVDPAGSIVFNGTRYRRTGSPAAPPGRSMHEVGLAADLRGRETSNPRIDDFSWIVANAPRFGLRTFADVNDEPWHVQPAELPTSRRRYEAQGAPWGSYPSFRPGAGGSAITATTKVSGGRTLGDVANEVARAGLTPALVARPGGSGDAVRVLVEALVGRGLLPDVAASRVATYGSHEQEVVRTFQQANGLEVDGIVGPNTWGALLAPIEPGEDSAMVRALKATLIVRGLIRDNAVNMGTDYGPLTQQRVRDFQALSGMDPIARVGPQTWTALLGTKRQVAVSTRGDEIDDDDIDDETGDPPLYDHVDLDDLDLLALLDGVPAT